MYLVHGLVMVLLAFLAIFLIILVLIQRGKGGGLAGAFGGLGGQSAFGTKAGDLFTRITIGVAAVWIILCIVSVRIYSSPEGRVRVLGGSATQGQEESPNQSGGGGAPTSESETASGAGTSGTGRGAVPLTPEAPSGADSSPPK